MNVLIVNTTLHTGGASIAAGRLAEALRGAGCEVRMLTRGNRMPQRLQFLRERFEALYYNGFDYSGVFGIDHGGCGTDITRLPEFEWADVVHLHWVNQAMLSLRDIERLALRCRQTNKRLVWTLHDIWPATGVCHLPQTCERWKTGCGDCPRLRCNAFTRLLPLCGRSPRDISSVVFRRKQEIYRQSDIAFVACSKYLADQVRQSPLMQGLQVTDIPNPLDTEFFSPCSSSIRKEMLREKMSLPQSKIIVLFVAYNINDANKGFSIFAEAIQDLVIRHWELKDRLCVVVVGKNATKWCDRSWCEMRPFEYVADRTFMRDLYRCADLFAMASKMENLPNTIVEAKACGLPVVATRVGGIGQMVRHGVDGYLVPPANVRALCNALGEVVLHPRREKLSLEARNDAVANYAIEEVTRRYLELYQALR